MKPLLLLVLALLAGCSTSRDLDQSRALHFQSGHTHPTHLISADALQPGDMLLSSATSVQSWGIRLFSMTGVSHAAIYIGEGQVAEAVGSGVKITPLADEIDESNNLLALRPTLVTPEQAEKLRAFALQQQGKKYNFKGIVMFMPFMVSRRLCELPLMNASLRDNCLTALASVQMGNINEPENNRYFCSEFVLDGYRSAGIELLHGEAHWMSPADLLHLREGDVSAWRAQQTMRYIGHLKMWNLGDILSLRSPKRQSD